MGAIAGGSRYAMVAHCFGVSDAELSDEEVRTAPGS
jgi:hypothetical protein